MKRRELLHKIAMGLGLFSLAPLAAHAKKPERLQVEVTSTNGMLFDSSTARTGVVDQGIRVFVNLVNNRAGKIQILNAQGAFLAADGSLLQTCPPQSLTLESRASDSIVFYYNNSQGLYDFKFDGQLEYAVDGVVTKLPILINNTQGPGPLNGY